MRTRRSQKAKPTATKKIAKTKPAKAAEPKSNRLPNQVPDVLFTEDGTTFYPCKHCCRAFAHRVDLKNHAKLCATAGKGTTIKPISPKTEEENNNKEEAAPQVPLKPQKEDTPNAKILTFNMIPDSINAYDLKTKAKIVKHLNETLENSPICVFVMENGDLVAKIQAASGQTQLEITSRSVDLNRVQITIKKCEDVAEEQVPELAEILERLFGHDATCFDFAFTDVQEDDVDEGSNAEEEEDIDADGTIVLEDLDIHICKQCGAVYHTLEDLVNHDKYEHRKVKKKFTRGELEKYTELFKRSTSNDCPICLKSLRSKSCWPRHMESHCDVGLFECSICKKKFSRDDHRKTHESRHIFKDYSDSD